MHPKCLETAQINLGGNIPLKTQDINNLGEKYGYFKYIEYSLKEICNNNFDNEDWIYARKENINFKNDWIKLDKYILTITHKGCISDKTILGGNIPFKSLGNMCGTHSNGNI